jgi:hypothetical protein
MNQQVVPDQSNAWSWNCMHNKKSVASKQFCRNINKFRIRLFVFLLSRCNCVICLKIWGVEISDSNV